MSEPTPTTPERLAQLAADVVTGQFPEPRTVPREPTLQELTDQRAAARDTWLADPSAATEATYRTADQNLEAARGNTALTTAWKVVKVELAEQLKPLVDGSEQTGRQLALLDRSVDGLLGNTQYAIAQTKASLEHIEQLNHRVAAAEQAAAAAADGVAVLRDRLDANPTMMTREQWRAAADAWLQTRLRPVLITLIAAFVLFEIGQTLVLWWLARGR